MAAGETLLKITDYPFAYSFVALLSGLAGYSISGNHLLFFGLAGAFGTLLAFTDPIGLLIKGQQKDYFKGKPNQYHCINALSKRAVGIEVDKIVGIIYFGITAGVFILALIFSSSFVNSLQITEKDKSVICDTFCIKEFGISGAGIALGLSIVFGLLRWVRDLPHKIMIAGTHQLAINNEFPVTNSVENMTNAIEQNDWITASEWGNKILEEIQYKRGKREIILRAGERIYRPLHKEAQGIIDNLNSMGIAHNYRGLVETLWTTIKQDADDMIIEDESLKKAIIEFYDDVYKYNTILGTVRKIINNIVLKRASEVYKRNITRIECQVSTARGGDFNPDLVDCATFDLHPKDYLDNGITKMIDVMYIDIYNHQQNEQMINPQNIADFDKVWALVIDDVKKDQNVINFKKLVTDIHGKAPLLVQKYREKIALEWKV